jgi:hypothetical protein
LGLAQSVRARAWTHAPRGDGGQGADDHHNGTGYCGTGWDAAAHEGTQPVAHHDPTGAQARFYRNERRLPFAPRLPRCTERARIKSARAITSRIVATKIVTG